METSDAKKLMITQARHDRYSKSQHRQRTPDATNKTSSNQLDNLNRSLQDKTIARISVKLPPFEEQ